MPSWLAIGVPASWVAAANEALVDMSKIAAVEIGNRHAEHANADKG